MKPFEARKIKDQRSKTKDSSDAYPPGLASLLHTSPAMSENPPSPSAWPRRLAICAVAAVALAVSIYLALSQWGLIASVWEPLFGDGSRRVLGSSVSALIRKTIGVPDAALGAIAYAVEIALALIGSSERWREHPWLVVLFGLDAIPMGIGSLALVLLQAFVIRAFCTLCLVSAICSWTVVALAHGELRAAVRVLRRHS